MIQTIVQLIKQDIELREARHTLEMKNKENEYNEIKKELDRVKKENEELKSQRNVIRWDKTGEYYNLKDFCRASKYILFFKESELKQYLYECGLLIRENDKYVPNKDSDICTLINNEIYVKYSYIRNNLILLRSLIFIGSNEDLNRVVKRFNESHDTITEKLGNTVYVECKQRSFEFRNCRENQNFIELNEATKRIEK